MHVTEGRGVAHTCTPHLHPYIRKNSTHKHSLRCQLWILQLTNVSSITRPFNSPLYFSCPGTSITHWSSECLGWQLGRCGGWEDAKGQVGVKCGWPVNDWCLLSWFACLCHPLNINGMFSVHLYNCTQDNWGGSYTVYFHGVLIFIIFCWHRNPKNFHPKR